MTFEQAQPYPGEHHTVLCDYCGDRGEVASRFDIPGGWENLGEDSEGPHMCRGCFIAAMRWVMEQVRKAGPCP